jgi:Family of unknown function (DUF5788)
MPQAIDDQSRRAIKGTSPSSALQDVQALKKEYGRAGTSAEEQHLITPDERRNLELSLHRMLVWVGVMMPFEFDLGGKKVPLHEIVWDLLSKDCLTEEEKESVRKLLWKLMAHEKADEEILHNNALTQDQAKKIFREAAGLLRAIMSLKSLVGEKEYCNLRSTASRRRVEDAKYWLGFLKQIT